MSFATDTLALLERLTALGPLPRVVALDLPPPPPDDGARGEFCAISLQAPGDAAPVLGLSYVLLGDTWTGLRAAGDRLVQPGDDPLALARRFTDTDPLVRTVAFAAINALTRWLYDRAGFAPPASGDSIGHLDPQPGETIGMIGHFTPLIPRIRERGAKLLVVELRADLVGERDGVRVTLDAGELAQCRKVLSTGTLLLNDTLDRMLGHCAGATHFAMVGPSVGCPPDALFARGVTLLGGSWVTDPLAYREALRAGTGTGGHARKYALTQADYPGWATLLAQAAARPA
jgi:uncharacterized protein (DUF4213/DUF364 family)